MEGLEEFTMFILMLEEFIIFILMLSVIFFLLQVILFFKIWAMTNNIGKIKETLEEWLDIEHPVIEENKESKRETKN